MLILCHYLLSNNERVIMNVGVPLNEFLKIRRSQEIREVVHQSGIQDLVIKKD